MAKKRLFTHGRSGPKSRLRQNIESIGLALLIALAVRDSVVQAFWVPSGSMLPTIQIGDHIFVNKLAYSIHLPFVHYQVATTGKPRRNDVVVFVSPVDNQTDLIKRVVAVAGDTVEIRNKRLYVNGKAVDDSHAHFMEGGKLVPGSAYLSKNGNSAAAGPRDNMAPVVVPEGKIFCLGDNRDRSYDSRFWGFADVSEVKGKATFIYWSRDSKACSRAFGRHGVRAIFSKACLPRWNRFGHFIEM